MTEPRTYHGHSAWCSIFNRYGRPYCNCGRPEADAAAAARRRRGPTARAYRPAHGGYPTREASFAVRLDRDIAAMVKYLRGRLQPRVS